LIPYYLFMDMIIVKLSIIAAYFIISWFYVDEFRNLAAGIAGYISKKRKFSVT